MIIIFEVSNPFVRPFAYFNRIGVRVGFAWFAVAIYTMRLDVLIGKVEQGFLRYEL